MTTAEEPAQFYTGLVAELYAALRSEDPDPEVAARFIGRHGEPALELGCGDGDPLLALRARGLEVEGLDSSADMLDRCRRRAAAAEIEVTLHLASMEDMALGRRYRSIFLAGASFTLLPDDETATQALTRIAEHLEVGGAALVPLFVPRPVQERHLGRAIEQRRDDGTILRCTAVSARHDEATRCQTTLLRYERIAGTEHEMLEREWLIHWHTQAGFRALAEAAGLRVAAVVGPTGRPATEADDQFAFVLTLPTG